MIEFACAFTGHRPSRFSFGYNEEHPKCVQLKDELKSQINKLISAGITTYYDGMALGVDLWAARIVLDIKKKNQDVKLNAVLPCETQANKWSTCQREAYFDMLAECDEVITLNTHYTNTCMYERNRYMTDHAQYLIAVYDGKNHGGTAHTVGYAKQNNREIILINPDTLIVTSAVDYKALQRRTQFKVISKRDE